MRDWIDDEQKGFTKQQICSINSFKLRKSPNSRPRGGLEFFKELIADGANTADLNKGSAF